MLGKQAKILALREIDDLLAFADCSRQPLRNRVMVLLSTKAGLRASEIAALTWDMVLGASGQLSNAIALRDVAAKKGSGRLVPMHPALADALSSWRQVCSGLGHVVRSERGGADDRAQHRSLVQSGLWLPRPGWLFIPFRPPHLHHPRGPIGARSRRVTARRSTVGRT